MPDAVCPEKIALPANSASHSRGRYQMSRSIVIRPTTRGLVVESLLTGRHVELTNRSQWKLFFAFASPVDPADLLAAVGHGHATTVYGFVEYCVARQLLVRVRADGTPDEDAKSVLWEPHDLYFHVRSRRGVHGHPVGSTYHLAGTAPIVPAIKPQAPTRVVPLDAPRRTDGDDVTLSAALEQRRSLYSVAPVDESTLSTFLYRTCRITHTSQGDTSGMVLKKVYPSGGSLHSLELYVVANRCPGLSRDLYRYRALNHDLVPLGNGDPEIDRLLSDAQQATGGKLPDLPSVLLILSTRFGRVARKYQSLAYSAVLKEVGALFQTMYLVATAMKLAPCAIGSGDSARFARVIDANPLEETSVGEFILGGAR